MLKRVKRAVVGSYVGAIALGWIFARAISHFENALTGPLTFWTLGDAMGSIAAAMGRPLGAMGISAQNAIVQGVAELLRCAVLLGLGYLLLRWLYFEPVNDEAPGPAGSAPAQ